MGFKKIKEFVPAFYHKFLPSIFDEEIPDESFAKCVKCPMIADSRAELDNEIAKPFAPDSKCCTFTPRLPNYFVGAFLLDESVVTGGNLLRDKIKSKLGVYPHGLYPDKKYSLLYELGRKEGFGRSILLKCPYYLQGDYNCSLWKYRESICATWFCKYLAGEAGRTFWYGMRDIFSFMQSKLLTYVLEEMGLDTKDPHGDDSNLSCEDLDSVPMKDSNYKKLWKHWEGKEEEFYTKSYRMISELSQNKFNELLGEEFVKMIDLLSENHQIMTKLPEMLMTDTELVLEEYVSGYFRVALKSLIDRNQTVINYAFDIPKIVFDIFRNGRKTSDAMADLSNIHNIDLGMDVLIALYHSGILVKQE